jgi:ankyrin repeat protein
MAPVLKVRSSHVGLLSLPGPDFADHICTAVDKRRSSEGPRELAIRSSDYLPTILAQHLFTSFMWTIVERLPKNCLRRGGPNTENDVKVLGGHRFARYEGEFEQTWYLPTLTHTKLSSVVQKIELAGLGTGNEILLCMIPALSFRDLLPNERMLDLMPSVNEGHGWVQTSLCYKALLSTSIGKQLEESFSYAVVVATMDFLILACEPFTDGVSPPEELGMALRIIVEIISTDFAHILKWLSPIYDLQNRLDAFITIFKKFGNQNSKDGPDFLRKGDLALEDPTLKDKLDMIGFSESHRRVYRASGRRERDRLRQPWERDRDLYWDNGKIILCEKLILESLLTRAQCSGESVLKPDIFGWTPLHYACLADEEVFEPTFDAIKGRFPIKMLKDNFSRSPMHLAVLFGNEFCLRVCLAEAEKGTVTEPGIDGMTLVHLAAHAGHEHCLDKLVENGESISKVDIWGRGVIHVAARAGNLAIVRKLLRKGSKPEQVDHFGNTPFAYLRKEKNGQQIASELMRAWKNFEFQDDSGRTCLHHAVDIADEGSIRDFVKHSGGTIVEVKDKKGRSPLHVAILAKRLDVTQALLDLHARPDIKDEEGATPLMFASKTGQEKIVKIILSMISSLTDGKDKVNDRDVHGMTALHYAASAEAEDIVEPVEQSIRQLLEIGANLEAQDEEGRTPLHIAILHKHSATAELLLSFDANADAKDKAGATSLMLACQNGQAVIRTLLARNKAAAGERDNAGQTILHYAVEYAHLSRSDFKDTLDAILATVTDINAKDERSRTPLHQAIWLENEDNAVCLLQRGADPATRDDSGEPPLITAVRRSCLKVIEFIITNHDDLVNEGDDSYGQTALSWACEDGKMSLVELLLKCPKVNINTAAVKYRLYTPLHLAIYSQRTDVVKLLVKQPGIDFSVQNEAGDPPLRFAMIFGQTEMVESLLFESEVHGHARVQFLIQLCSISPETFEIGELFLRFLALIPEDEFTAETLGDVMRQRSVYLNPELFSAALDRILQLKDWKSQKQLLYFAARCGHRESVTKLIQRRADPFQRDEDNWTCLDIADRYGYKEIRTDLSKYMASRDPQAAYTHVAAFEPLVLVRQQGRGDGKVVITECDAENHHCSGFNREFSPSAAFGRN